MYCGTTGADVKRARQQRGSVPAECREAVQGGTLQAGMRSVSAQCQYNCCASAVTWRARVN